MLCFIREEAQAQTSLYQRQVCFIQFRTETSAKQSRNREQKPREVAVSAAMALRTLGTLVEMLVEIEVASSFPPVFFVQLSYSSLHQFLWFLPTSKMCKPVLVSEVQIHVLPFAGHRPLHVRLLSPLISAMTLQRHTLVVAALLAQQPSLCLSGEALLRASDVL
jgi:hypothetical protein